MRHGCITLMAWGRSGSHQGNVFASEMQKTDWNFQSVFIFLR